METRIPVLIKVQSEIKFGGKSFDEPKIRRCDNCGGNLFYISNRFGLVKSCQWLHNVPVVGETEESKKFRAWVIEYICEERYCAICGCSNGLINIWPDEDIVKLFDNDWYKNRYEIALDVIKYPQSATKEKKEKYKKEIEKIKNLIIKNENKKGKSVIKKGK